MSGSEADPTHVHLVGAIAIDTVPEVFRTVGGILGPRLKRVPDGEPGGRRMWIAWQFPLLRASPFLKPLPIDPNAVVALPKMALADGVTAEELRFSELGYAREAFASYADFKAARAAGELPAGVRFQVSLPTPYAVISAFCDRADLATVEPAYERAMLREVETICGFVPHEDLAIQWDICPEMVAWDGRAPWLGRAFDDMETELFGRIARISAAVPEDVELGFHLCYGDVDGKHFIDPVDAGKLVEFANNLAKWVRRPIAWIHMPVPIGRTDDDYYRPLAELGLDPKTEVYLGCVHAEDGVAGTRQRIAAARKYLPAFGIATECGMGRSKRPETVMALLHIHAGATAEP
ncbi:MAG TPA: hypothetical protein VKS60_21425 [Stellaceae bacterium]|nr:hypothetical protein [Stellaceae bacterium]